METGATVVALYRQRSCLVLHCKVAAYCTRPVADEVISLGETTTFDEIMEEVIQSFLSKMLLT